MNSSLVKCSKLTNLLLQIVFRKPEIHKFMHITASYINCCITRISLQSVLHDTKLNVDRKRFKKEAKFKN